MNHENKEINQFTNKLINCQKDLNKEMKTFRAQHTNLLHEKDSEVNFLNGIINNYQNLISKINNENKLIESDITKIDLIKKQALNKIGLLVNEVNISNENNNNLKIQLAHKPKESIIKINEIQNNAAQQIHEFKPASNVGLYSNFNEIEIHNSKIFYLKLQNINNK